MQRFMREALVMNELIGCFNRYLSVCLVSGAVGNLGGNLGVYHWCKKSGLLVHRG